MAPIEDLYTHTHMCELCHVSIQRRWLLAGWRTLSTESLLPVLQEIGAVVIPVYREAAWLQRITCPELWPCFLNLDMEDHGKQALGKHSPRR